MKLFVTIGCAGVGKSTYIKNNKSVNGIIISPDEERRLKGDVSKQFPDVFDICYKKLSKAEGEVWFDATSLEISYLNNLIKYSNNLEELTLILFENSRNSSFCKNNIKRDLENKIDRAKVPDEVVDKMSKKYIMLVDSKNFEIWAKEHNAKIRRVK